METKVKITESALRRIIHEELIEHYLIQRDLWDDETDHQQKSLPVNEDGQKA